MPLQSDGRRPQRFQRDRNLSLVMNALREGGPASRSELAAALNLDRSTLTHLSNALLAAGLIVEADERSAGKRGGRRPRPLALNPEHYAVVGVDIRARDAEWVLLRLDGSVRDGGVVARGDADALHWLETVATSTIDALRPARNGSLLMLGVGVSVPGVVDNGAGMLLRSVVLGLESVRIGEYWSEIGAPVLVDNDANCCAWNLAGDPVQPQNIVLSQIKLHQSADGAFQPSGAGIGLAFILNGSIYYGTRGAAGELRGVRWTAASPDQLGLRLDRIQADRGDAEALRALAAEILRNLSVVASVFDPDAVVLTGDGASLSPAIADLLTGELAGSPIAALAEAGSLTIAPPTAYPAAQGAARMMLAHLFEFSAGANGNLCFPGGWQSIVDRFPGYSS
ncbi:MAG: ROK family protein [Spirochaetia bacterium]